MSDEKYTVDKSKYLDGPWMNEPDYEEFYHAGVRCVIKRTPSGGHLCGYVAIPRGHPDYCKINTDDESSGHYRVHGGITYAEKTLPPIYDTGLWWIGFDCAHAGDFCPRHSMASDKDESYRDIGFVRFECAKLAAAVCLRGGGKPSDAEKSTHGGPAFPIPTDDWRGMELRDWFAGQAPEVPDWFVELFDYSEPKPVRDKSLDTEWCCFGHLTGDRKMIEQLTDEQRAVLPEIVKGHREHALNVSKWEGRKKLAALAAWRFEYADAMLKQREETNE